MLRSHDAAVVAHAANHRERHAPCARHRGQRVQGCGITDFGHCWPNYPGAGNPECQDQNPANVDASLHLLDFFNSLPAGSTWDEK